MQKIELADRKQCTGCLACASICNFKAIKTVTDEGGFYYPDIIEDKCVRCGKCMEVCYILNDFFKPEKDYALQTYFGKHIKQREQMTSQSGGAFWAIAESILREKGVVYGSALDSSFCARHIRTTDINDAKRLKGSKYVQSYIGKTYRQVAEDLLLGRKVLFSGTPCQIAGVYSYLRTKHLSYENLITCDLICHGVPSPKIWNDYMHFIERKYKRKITDANFRDKTFGWKNHMETFKFADSSHISLGYYVELFYNNCILRTCCSTCKFSNCERVGDLTIGDCWGIEKYNPQFYDKKGVSLLLVNTKKGQRILENISSDFQYYKIEKQYIMQQNLIAPTPVSSNKDIFWEKYIKYGFRYIMHRYTSYGVINRIKKQLGLGAK